METYGAYYYSNLGVNQTPENEEMLVLRDQMTQAIDELFDKDRRTTSTIQGGRKKLEACLSKLEALGFDRREA